ncbi:unnamed protein product [Haemonchus placei]|uniref:ADF-H domain-containing protein n=1 Tax=Haemonchus placei TaxID=6290 RepID=A0A0N4WKV1_HAEPC|nr:unnamed protein product [Haemonchus placei]
MTLNFQKHAAAIQSAYDRVVSSESNEEWVIFDYDGISNVLKVGDEGDYGIEEFATSFNSGRLQYGVIGVRPEKNALTKIVLVHWQGEGVPSARVAATTSHIDAVRRYLKKVHVTIYARSEIDVEPDVIRREVAKLPPTFSSPTQYQGANNVDQHKAVQERLLRSPNKLNSHRKEIFEQKETAALPHSIAVSHHNEKEKSSVPTASSRELCHTSLSPLLRNYIHVVIAVSPQQTQIYSCDSAASRSESGYETAGDSKAATADEIPQHNEQPLTLVGGLKARALWDYQAADGTEISFEPDDIITEIDQVELSALWCGLVMPLHMAAQAQERGKFSVSSSRML